MNVLWTIHCISNNYSQHSITIHLLCIRTGSGLRRRQSVSHLIRVNPRFILVERLELFNKGIESFWIVFGNIEFKTESIKGAMITLAKVNTIQRDKVTIVE